MCAICEFKIEFDVSHPHALSVAVATRAAIDEGKLPERLFDGPLGNMKMRAAAVDALKDLQGQLEAAVPSHDLMALPDFYVLLIENATWGFFRATANGFDPDVVPDAPNVTAETQADRDVVIVLAETTLRSLLDGRFSLGSALSGDLIVFDATPSDKAAFISVLDRALSEVSPVESSNAQL